MKARSAQGVLTLLNFLPVPAHGVIVSTHVRKYVICTNWNVYMAPFNVLYCKVVIDFVMVKLVLTFDLYVYDVFICTSVFIVCPCSHCIISHQKPLTTAISLKGKDLITTVHCTFLHLSLHHYILNYIVFIYTLQAWNISSKTCGVHQKAQTCKTEEGTYQERIRTGD